jgi:hypothetical protein
MKLFKCPNCGQLLAFENTRCQRCKHRLGYVPTADRLVALDQDGTAWRSVTAPAERYRFCANAEDDVCNWLIAAESSATFCLACRHNRTIPDLSDAGAVLSWRKIELAKHRLIYSLLRLGLPHPVSGEGREPLVFDFLADPPVPDGRKAMTGHDDGLITIALAEADDAERERRRAQMGEPYRTILGHFRHEIGHYYWDILVRDGGWLDRFRATFGDDRADYQAALERYYRSGPPPDWEEHYVSRYATMHPWEDFAETWAHYLHIVDSLEMARAVAMSVRPQVDDTGALSAAATLDPYGPCAIEDLVATWVPLAFAMNAVNRCMGQSDLYPFVLSPVVVGKLRFIHTLLQSRRANEDTTAVERRGAASPG